MFAFTIATANSHRLKDLRRLPRPSGVQVQLQYVRVVSPGGLGSRLRATVRIHRDVNLHVVSTWLRTRLGEFPPDLSVDGIPASLDCTTSSIFRGASKHKDEVGGLGLGCRFSVGGA